jgi:hypothetical protein
MLSKIMKKLWYPEEHKYHHLYKLMQPKSKWSVLSLIQNTYLTAKQYTSGGLTLVE